MSDILSKIKSNSKKLPEKDLKYADKFIANRDFESLLEIVESDIIKLDKRRNADGLFSDEKDAELDVSYRELAGDIISYIRLIEPDFQLSSEDYEEEFDSAVEGEDFDW